MKYFRIHVKGIFICSIYAKNLENAKQLFCDLHVESDGHSIPVYDKYIWQVKINCIGKKGVFQN